MRYTLLTTVAAAALALGIPMASAQTSQAPDSAPTIKRPPAHETAGSTDAPSPKAQGHVEDRSGATTDRAGASDAASGPKMRSSQSNSGASSNTGSGQSGQRDAQHKKSPEATGATNEAKSGSDMTKHPARAAQSSDKAGPDAQKAPHAASGNKSNDTAKSSSPDKSSADKSAAEHKSGSQTRSTAETNQREDANPASRRQGASATESTSSTRQGAANELSGKDRKGEASAELSSKSSVSSAMAKLDTEKRSDVIHAFTASQTNVVNNVNFKVSVGATVSEHVHLAPVPETIVEIVPQFRGYDYVVVRDEIIIVQPRTRKIVEVIHKSGGSSGKSASIHLTKEQRRTFRTAVETTGSTRAPDRIEVRTGVTLPEDIVLEDIPQTIVTEVPAIREYRYVVIGSEIALVEPQTRRVIEVFPE
jgi:hypothetical protein